MALYLSSFIPQWSTLERGAFDVSVTEPGNVFQDYGFFPLGLGLVVALLATGFALSHMLGFRRSDARLTLGLCVLSFLLVLIGAVVGPGGAPSSVAVGTIEARRGVMLYVGIVLAGLMAWGAWQDVRTPASAFAEARE